MDKSDLERIEKLASQYPDINYLWQKHSKYEKELLQLEKISFPTAEEENNIRELKKQKLEGKTKLIALLDQYTKEER